MSQKTFRQVKAGPDPLGELPPEMTASLGRSGEGALAVVGARGPVVLLVRWLAEPSAL